MKTYIEERGTGVACIPLFRDDLKRALTLLGKQRARGFTAKNSLDDARSFVRLSVNSDAAATVTARTKPTAQKDMSLAQSKRRTVTVSVDMMHALPFDVSIVFPAGRVLALLRTFKPSDLIMFSIDFENDAFIIERKRDDNSVAARFRFLGHKGLI